MSDCEHVQEMIATEVARRGREPAWEDAAIAAHLVGCAACRAVLAQELELCLLLDEPLPLPPHELIPGVMARIATESSPSASLDRSEQGLAWAERFAWAASGAVAMYGLERLPELSEPWLSEVALQGLATLTALSAPFELNWLYLVVLGLGLLVAQGAMVYQVRSSAS